MEFQKKAFEIYWDLLTCKSNSAEEEATFFRFDHVCACHNSKLNCSYYVLLSRFHSRASEHQHRKLNADAKLPLLRTTLIHCATAKQCMNPFRKFSLQVNNFQKILFVYTFINEFKLKLYMTVLLCRKIINL